MGKSKKNAAKVYAAPPDDDDDPRKSGVPDKGSDSESEEGGDGLGTEVLEGGIGPIKVINATPNKRGSMTGRRTSVQHMFSNVDAGMVNDGKPKKMLSTWVDYEEEGLGDAFEETPWCPPQVLKCREFVDVTIYRGGKSSIWHTEIHELEDMGIGVSLYFSFVKFSTFLFFVLSCLSFPALVFAWNGTAMGSDVDVTGFSKLTIANVGLPCQPETGVPELMTGCDLTADSTVTVEGNLVALKDMSAVITAFDFMGVVFFYLMIWFWKAFTARAVRKVKENKCTTPDYAVHVEGLPKECDKEEVGKFFSNLYQLDREDWKGRPPQDGSSPVTNVANTGDNWYIGKWVAEVQLAHAVGLEVKAYKSKRDTMIELRRCRAKAKMYNEGTSLMGGEGDSASKFAKYAAKADSLSMKISKTTEKIMAYRSKNDKESKECVGAFVTFQEPLSLHRCLTDYQSLGWGWWRYPAHLKFLGHHKLKVKPAPEPDNVVFENLEFPSYLRGFRRAMTTIASTLLLIISFIAILSLHGFKTTYGDSVPSLSDCTTEIPAAFLGNYDEVKAVLKDPTEALTLVRPSVLDRTTLDEECATITGDVSSIYAVYSLDATPGEGWKTPAVTYSMDACHTLASHDQCPNSIGNSVFCPCISATSPQVCDSLQCAEDKADTGRIPAECSTFILSTMAGCYCSDRLFGSQSVGGLISSGKDVRANDPVCSDFVHTYTIAAGLSIVISVSTPIINMLLKGTQKAMVYWQRSTSDDETATRIMSSVFRAQFINTGLLMLLVFGRPPDQANADMPAVMQEYQIFTGDFDDFNRAWYGTVGAQLCVSFVLASITPHIGPLLSYFVIQPLKRARAVKAINAGKGPFAMQHDLNQLFVGAQFDFTTRYSYLLTIIFVSMTYSSGIPILMPITFFVMLASYWIDKTLLLRFYRRPPHREDALQQQVNSLLPIAVVFHLSFACWMFSAPVLLSESIGQTAAIASQYVNTIDTQDTGGYGWVLDRVMRTNVFPIFLLWAVIACVTLIGRLNKIFPLLDALWWLVTNVLCCVWCWAGGERKRKIMGLSFQSSYTSEVAPFTDVYFNYVPKGFKLTTQQKLEGWMTSQLPGGLMIKKKGWDVNQTAPSDAYGVSRDEKYTWEVIADNAVYTYNIEHVPGYAEIMGAMNEEERLYKMDNGELTDDSSTDSDSDESEESEKGSARVAAKGGGKDKQGAIKTGAKAKNVEKEKGASAASGKKDKGKEKGASLPKVASIDEAYNPFKETKGKASTEEDDDYNPFDHIGK